MDGYKKRVRISNGHEETIQYLNGHFPPEGCYKGKWEDGGEAYGYMKYPQAGRQHRLWRLYKYASSGNIEYDEQYHDNGWNIVVTYKFNANTLTWTKK